MNSTSVELETGLRRQETGHDDGRSGCHGTSMVEKPPYKTDLVENLHR
jgi:hypothetical protein